jgi:peptide/nickel transport system substrate-binding protein
MEEAGVMRTRKTTGFGIALAAVLALVVAATLGASGAGASSQAASYPRSETLITSGTQWGNITGFNPYGGNYAAGMIGLNLETLLRFDPIKDRYINWLASSAKWTGAKQFTVVVRPGVKWSNGKTFTAADVKFNLSLLRFETSQWHNLYENIKSIATSGNRVVVTFKSTPNYVQWQNAMYNIPMISPVQGKVITTPALLTTYNPNNPVGTGPYVLDRKGYDPTTRVVWVKRAHWWAADKGVSPSPKPKYIIDLVNTSNTNSLSAVLAGVEDLNNNFLPGVEQLVASGKVQTYYKKAPYMLSANTAMLEPNLTVKPLNDALFRRALATAIDIQKIVKDDYHQLVLPANPTGLLPTWNKYVDKAAVKTNGFTFSTSKAKTLLQDGGYKLGGDGYFQNRDGSKIDLDISVPQGWSDWETARDMIISSAKAAGIRIHSVVKDFNTWQTDRNTGKFDLVIDNHYQISDNPWSYWNGIYHLPILTEGAGQQNFNFQRYENKGAWALVQKLDKTPLSNTAAIKKINVQLQTTLMKDLPIIPLWYNGQWAQFTSKYWTNWPAASTSRQFTPIMWGGYLNMTGIDMITHLQKK